jgi:hypothetical protein
VIAKILGIPIACATIATAMYFIQGGFGGGHGDLDPLIFYLGSPATLFLTKLPIPDAVTGSDLALIVWWPAAVNFFLLWVPMSMAAHFISRRKK